VTSADDMAPDALRQLVREVLRDVLPTLALPASDPGARPPAGHPGAPLPPPIPGARPPAGLPGAPLPAGAYQQSPVTGPPSRPPSRPPTSVPRSDSAPARSDGAARPARGPVPGGGRQLPDGLDGLLQEVRLSTDEELHAFVLQVLRLADNPKRRHDILAGRLRFTLAAAADGHQVPAIIQRIDKGAVTERAVIAAAKAGARLVLGPRAVLTPLARDKARALAVPVEKER
jgi:hypothetical protein